MSRPTSIEWPHLSHVLVPKRFSRGDLNTTLWLDNSCKNTIKLSTKLERAFRTCSQSHTRFPLNEHMFISTVNQCVNHITGIGNLGSGRHIPAPSRNTMLRQFTVLAFCFLQQTQFRDWSFVLPALSMNHDRFNFPISPRMSTHDPSQWPHSSRLLQFCN